MIHTVTFSPSLDYVVQLDSLLPGKVNRTKTEALYPGGKGVNVSVVLSNLGIESRALGFIAGFTGRELERRLTAFGCQSDFIPLQRGMTRINVKIKAKEESEINGQGPVITREGLLQLFSQVQEIQQGDTLVLGGSIPNTLPKDMYERLIASVASRGIRTVVDAANSLLVNVLKYRPFLIKPNHHELGEIFQTELLYAKDIIRYAKRLQEMGARNVLVSMAGNGAILLSEQGSIYRSLPPAGKVVSSVGAGDAMVAGFLAGYERTGDYQTAFRLGLTAGSATAFTSWLATKEQVETLLGIPIELL